MRKSSPGKTLFSSANPLQSSLERSSTSPVRTLDFSSQSVPKVNQSFNQSGSSVPLQSWADKVRGTPSSASATAAVKQTDTREVGNQNSTPGLRRSSKNLEDCVVEDANDDEEGWETVHRGRKMHSNHAKKGNKSSYHNEKTFNGKTETKSNNLGKEKVTNGTFSNGNVDYNNHSGGKNVCNEQNSNSVEATEKLTELSDGKESPPVFLDNEEEQESLSDIEHEKALSAAMEEEESLSRQIEEFHNQTIASVIEHEESLTKEIAEEKELVTQINGESDSQAADIEQEEDVETVNGDEGDSLNCSSATNGDSVSW